MFYVFFFFLMTTVISAQYGEVPEQLESEVKSASSPPVHETEKVNLNETEKASEFVSSCQAAQQKAQHNEATEKNVNQEQQQTDDRKYGLFRFSRNDRHDDKVLIIPSHVGEKKSFQPLFTRQAESNENKGLDSSEQEKDEEVKNIQKRQIKKNENSYPARYYKPISNEIAKRKPPVSNFGDHPNMHPHRHPLKYPNYDFNKF